MAELRAKYKSQVGSTCDYTEYPPGVFSWGDKRVYEFTRERKWFGKTSTDLFRLAVNEVKIALLVANIRGRIGT